MFSDKNIVLLVGGVGGAKLAYGLAQILPPEKLTVVVNTGDDFWHYGLRICPDIDTITYTLSGLVDTQNGWGLRDDSTITLDALRALGDETWFKLGDRDLATHMLRTHWLAQGETLTEITQKLTKAVNISCQIYPMTNDPVATIVETLEYGELPFQEYFVKHRWQPTLRFIYMSGSEQATLTQEVQSALEQADAIIIGPSNPFLSIAPILSVPGMQAVIESRNIPRIAVTPIIQGDAIKGPTAKIMRELQIDISPQAVIDFYDSNINGFVYDVRDTLADQADVKTMAFDTLMTNNEKRIELAKAILEWIRNWN